MTLVENWRTVVRKSWAVRMAALAAVVQGVGLVADIASNSSFSDGAKFALGAIGIACSIGAIYARTLYQRSLSDGDGRK